MSDDDQVDILDCMDLDDKRKMLRAYQRFYIHWKQGSGVEFSDEQGLRIAKTIHSPAILPLYVKWQHSTEDNAVDNFNNLVTAATNIMDSASRQVLDTISSMITRLMFIPLHIRNAYTLKTLVDLITLN